MGPRRIPWIAIVLVVLLPALGLSPARARSARSLRPLLFGVTMHPLQHDYAGYPPAQTLARAKRLGVSVVRIDIDWNWLEWKRPGTATWYSPEVHRLDAFLNEAHKEHIQVLATVVDSPCWASMPANRRCRADLASYRGIHTPLHPLGFAAFLKRLVAHVGTKIGYYEIWNEPNAPRFWSHPDPVRYVRLLRAAYRAVKQADPQAQVLGGATSGADVSFVDRMYAAGAKGWFDALSIHPYSGKRTPEACTVPQHSFGCGVEAVHAAMLRHGDIRPLWLTEFGTEVSPTISDRVQAAYVTHALALIRTWSFVRGAIWYELHDDPTGHDGEHYGLLRANLSPRPAAHAFTAGVQNARRTRRPLRPGHKIQVATASITLGPASVGTVRTNRNPALSSSRSSIGCLPTRLTPSERLPWTSLPQITIPVVMY